jgi:hypothetical protein
LPITLLGSEWKSGSNVGRMEKNIWLKLQNLGKIILSWISVGITLILIRKIYNMGLWISLFELFYRILLNPVQSVCIYNQHFY